MISVLLVVWLAVIVRSVGRPDVRYPWWEKWDRLNRQERGHP
jgi:hypothetical protein